MQTFNSFFFFVCLYYLFIYFPFSSKFTWFMRSRMTGPANECLARVIYTEPDVHFGAFIRYRRFFFFLGSTVEVVIVSRGDHAFDVITTNLFDGVTPAGFLRECTHNIIITQPFPAGRPPPPFRWNRKKVEIFDFGTYRGTRWHCYYRHNRIRLLTKSLLEKTSPKYIVPRIPPTKGVSVFLGF